MGFDPSILLGAQGVQVPDPVKQFATTLSLGDLARRGRMGDLEEEQARRGLDAQKSYESALPDLVRSNFSTDAIVNAVTTNPQAAGAILKESDARRKAALDQRKTSADAGKTEAETRKIDLAMVGGMAQAILTNPGAGARDLDTLAGVMSRVGIDPNSFGDRGGNPASWVKAVASSSIDAAKQIELSGAADTRAETGRHNVATEGLTADQQREAARHNRMTEGLTAAGQAQGMTIANMQDARARDLATATREANQGNRIDSQTAALAKFVDSNALPNLLTSANALDATIQKYSGVRDMPGVGMIDANKPNWIQSTEGNKVRSQIQAVANDLLKLYSGGAVTANEAERRATEMMASGTFNETDLRNAWPLVKGRINAAVANARGGFSPEAISTYEQRGGMKLRPIGSDPAREAVQGGSAGPLSAAPAGSGVDFVYTPGGGR